MDLTLSAPQSPQCNGGTDAQLLPGGLLCGHSKTQRPVATTMLKASWPAAEKGTAGGPCLLPGT